MRVTPVQGHVYMLAGAGGNIALQAGSDGVLLVDSGTADRADAVIATLRQLTASPIRLIINTSAASDHTGGNDPLMRTGRRFATVFGRSGGPGDQPGAAIMARQGVQNRMIAEKALECALPSTTYDYFRPAASSSTVKGSSCGTCRRPVPTLTRSSSSAAPMSWQPVTSSTRISIR